MTNRREKTTGGEPETKYVALMLETLIETNRAQARELDELARLVEAEAADARQREADLAAQLDEARGELVEAVAAAEVEKEKRIAAEQEAVAARAAIDQAREILAKFSAPPAANALAMEESVATEQEEAEPGVSPAGIAGAEGRDPLDGGSGADPEEQSDPVEDGPSAGETTVTLALSPAETAALTERAAREGFGDGAAYATHLVRESLRQVGRPAALASVAAGNG